jgi:hypothetical protein
MSIAPFDIPLTVAHKLASYRQRYVNEKDINQFLPEQPRLIEPKQAIDDAVESVKKAQKI